MRRSTVGAPYFLPSVDDNVVAIECQKLLDESGKDRLVALTDKMVKKADVRWLVTAEMI